MRGRALVLLTLLGAVAFVRADDTPAAKPTPEGVEFFEKKVRPVLVKHCYSCHSAGAEKLKGELRLDTRAGVLRGGASGRVVVPGDPATRLLGQAGKHAHDVKPPPPQE